MYTGTYEDELIEACQRMGYGVNIDGIRGRVILNTGSGLRRDDHRFTGAAVALAWLEQQERERNRRLAAIAG